MTECAPYTEFAKEFHEPGSGGPLNLPFQRPLEPCRRFVSRVIETVIDSVSAKMANADVARLFTNAFPNTLDTTIERFDSELPLTFVITGDIHAMWLRDSANQLLPYLKYATADLRLKQLILGAIFMQAQLIQLDPYANAFLPNMTVHEQKWEVDSLASFLGLSHRYWQVTGDDAFAYNATWVGAVDKVIQTIHEQQEPTFDPVTGEPMPVYYSFTQYTNRPTETQYLSGRGNAVKRTGLVKSLFRPSDDATIYPFFIPGNAMLSVELAHISHLLHYVGLHDRARETSRLAEEIKSGIYKYGVLHHPEHGQIFAYEVDGYGSALVMDDANVPSLLSLPLIGFVPVDDPTYQRTRRLVLSSDNPFYFSGPRLSGIGGPHVDLSYAWPMSRIVQILTSTDDQEISQAIESLVSSTDGTGLIHESVHVYRDGEYTRSWFAWANGLFGQAILKIAEERPHLIFHHECNAITTQ